MPSAGQQIEVGPSERGNVAIRVNPGHGQPEQFFELAASEALRLAKDLQRSGRLYIDDGVSPPLDALLTRSTATALASGILETLRRIGNA